MSLHTLELPLHQEAEVSKEMRRHRMLREEAKKTKIVAQSFIPKCGHVALVLELSQFDHMTKVSFFPAFPAKTWILSSLT